MSKLRVTQQYGKLSEELREQIKLVYPDGYKDYLTRFPNKEGKQISALRFETDEKIYLIRMTFQQAMDIVEADEDFDDNGTLNEDVKDDYEEKYSEVEYLSENENYE
ncbi:MAG: hypothetical protein ACI85I_002710 [Arenicella sp.]|jgi:hypothetical protein